MKCFRFLFGIVFAAVAVNAWAFSPTAMAGTFPGRNGDVAYELAQGGSTDIRIVHADGSHNRLLVHGARSPVWSPNGRKLAFIDQNNRLQTIHHDGSQQKLLANTQGTTESSPAWLADGSRIAFVRTKLLASGARQSAIFTMKPNGTREANVTGWSQNSIYASPSWSPDGSRLLYEKRTDNNRALYVKNLTVNHERLLTTLSDNIDSHVSWSPSGKKILYNDSSNEVYTIWPDGTHRAVISDGDSYQASWSPDGSKIAFLEDPNDEAISLSEPDGSISYVPVQKIGYQTIGMPTWSPNGQKLAFTLQSGQQVAGLFVLSLGSTAQPLKIASGNIRSISWQAR